MHPRRRGRDSRRWCNARRRERWWWWRRRDDARRKGHPRWRPHCGRVSHLRCRSPKPRGRSSHSWRRSHSRRRWRGRWLIPAIAVGIVSHGRISRVLAVVSTLPDTASNRRWSWVWGYRMSSHGSLSHALVKIQYTVPSNLPVR